MWGVVEVQEDLEGSGKLVESAWELGGRGAIFSPPSILVCPPNLANLHLHLSPHHYVLAQLLTVVNPSKTSSTQSSARDGGLRGWLVRGAEGGKLGAWQGAGG